MITDPGFYYDMSAEDYHADPCPKPSLSGSVGIPLVHRSPMHAKHMHPRLTPKGDRIKIKDHLEFGSACHALLFEQGRQVLVLDYDNYKSNDAKEARKSAYSAGRVPILAGKYEQAKDMAYTARGFLLNCGQFHLDDLRLANVETCIAWKEEDEWCRGLIDLISRGALWSIDYKTTSGSAAPYDAERTLYDLNYHFKAAFYERGLNVLRPEDIGRRKSFFLFQETAAPYACSLLRPSESGMMLGRKQVMYAINRWKECMKRDMWPGYPLALHLAPLPTWLEKRWTDREELDPLATGELSYDPGETPVEHERNWETTL